MSETTKSEKRQSFTKEERDAMKERAKELKAEQGKADGLADVLEKIAEMTDADRALAEAVHHIVTTTAPELEPKTWYGSPAYAKAGKVICFFQGADKFKTRYATLGFSDQAQIDDGTMWPTSYALTSLTSADEKAIAALVKKAAG